MRCVASVMRGCLVTGCSWKPLSVTGRLQLLLGGPTFSLHSLCCSGGYIRPTVWCCGKSILPMHLWSLVSGGVVPSTCQKACLLLGLACSICIAVLLQGDIPEQATRGVFSVLLAPEVCL